MNARSDDDPFRAEIERRYREAVARHDAVLLAIGHVEKMSELLEPSPINGYKVRDQWAAYQQALRALVDAFNDESADPDRLRNAAASALRDLWIALARWFLDSPEQLEAVPHGGTFALEVLRDALVAMGADEVPPEVDHDRLRDAYARGGLDVSREARGARAVGALLASTNVRGGAKTAKRRLDEVEALAASVRLEVARLASASDVGSSAPTDSGTVRKSTKRRPK